MFCEYRASIRVHTDQLRYSNPRFLNIYASTSLFDLLVSSEIIKRVASNPQLFINPQCKRLLRWDPKTIKSFMLARAGTRTWHLNSVNLPSKVGVV